MICLDVIFDTLNDFKNPNEILQNIETLKLHHITETNSEKPFTSTYMLEKSENLVLSLNNAKTDANGDEYEP